MDGERYPGEQRGLRLFLEGLVQTVADDLGRDSLLYHRIRTALDRGDLASLRDARQMFNHQDPALKRRLSLARTGCGGPPDYVHLVYARDSGPELAPATVIPLPVAPRGLDGAD